MLLVAEFIRIKHNHSCLFSNYGLSVHSEISLINSNYLEFRFKKTKLNET